MVCPQALLHERTADVRAIKVGVGQIAVFQFPAKTRVTITATQPERFLQTIASASVTLAGQGQTVRPRILAGIFAVGMVQHAVRLPLTIVVVIAKPAMRVPIVMSSHVAETRVVAMV